MNMVAYISRTIERSRAISLEAGQAKYKAYFVTTANYLVFKADVDSILAIDGMEDCIVTA